MKNTHASLRAIAASAFAVAALVGVSPLAQAQTATTTNMAGPGVPMSMTMVSGNANGGTPVFYNNGTAVNPNGTAVPAGNYTNQQGQQIYYYGNGTYYNSSTGQYGGQAFGVAPGSIIAQGPTTVTPTVTASGTPGVPNTGAGGQSAAVWAMLALSAAVGIGGVAYLTATRKQHRV